MTMVFFFAIIMALGVWSAHDTGPHHPHYVEDISWQQQELYASDKLLERNHE
tara:strand:- start:2180 stop:2335 length:156 start_codon:yes stop_codon:yes gene_type:complete